MVFFSSFLLTVVTAISAQGRHEKLALRFASAGQERVYESAQLDCVCFVVLVFLRLLALVRRARPVTVTQALRLTGRVHTVTTCRRINEADLRALEPRAVRVSASAEFKRGAQKKVLIESQSTIRNVPLRLRTGLLARVSVVAGGFRCGRL